MINTKKTLLMTAVGLMAVFNATVSASDLAAADLESASISQSNRAFKGKEPLSELPTLSDEVWLNIIRQADPETRGHLALADHHMHNLVRDPIEMIKRGEVLQPRSAEEFMNCVKTSADLIEKGVVVDLSKLSRIPAPVPNDTWYDNTINMLFGFIFNSVKQHNLSKFEQITDVSLKYLKNATSLNLERCNQITDADLAYLTNVTSLNLVGCYKITDAGLAYLKNVRTLNLSWCSKITDAGLRHLSNATSLNLAHCRKITGEGFKHLTNVRTLNLEDCDQISDADLASLTNVTSLNVGGCNQITDAGLASLKNGRTLNVSYCVPDAGVLAFFANAMSFDCDFEFYRQVMANSR